MFGISDILGGVGETIAGLTGAGDDQQRQAAEALRQALEQYKNLNPESAAALAATAQAGPAAAVDPRGMAGMADALNALQGVYKAGGMTAADRLAQEQATNQALQSDKARNDAILQEMAARGQAGGGAELAARLAGGQQTANAAHGAGATSAIAAQGRALQAMLSSGQLGGQMTDAAQRQAEQQNAMARFNAAQRIGAHGMAWGQGLDKAQGMAGVYGNQAGYYNAEAQRQRAKAAGIGRGIGTAIGGAADAYMANPSAAGFDASGASTVPYYLRKSGNGDPGWGGGGWGG